MICPANWRQSADEFAFVIDDFDPKVIVWQDEEIGEPVPRARELASSAAVWIRHDTDEAGGYDDLLPQRHPNRCRPTLTLMTRCWSSIPPRSPAGLRARCSATAT